jgi:hypothetical protein
MPIAFARFHAIVPRGGARLACDEDEVSLDPA